MAGPAQVYIWGVSMRSGSWGASHSVKASHNSYSVAKRFWIIRLAHSVLDCVLGKVPKDLTLAGQLPSKRSYLRAPTMPSSVKEAR